ncbi:MAG: hypothetical protein ACM3H9_04800 [Rhodospirillaceae bacterium]
MKRFTTFTCTLIGCALLVSFVPAAPAAAQASQAGAAQLTAADVRRLQESVFDANTEIARLRSYDAERAKALQARLDDLSDEVIYLKVKLRKEGASRAEYGTLRDQIDDIRIEARSLVPAPGRAGVPVPAPDRDEPVGNVARQGTTTRPNEIPAGTELDVRLETPLNSETAKLEDRFTASTIADLYNGEVLLIPAGSPVRGIVTGVAKAGRVERTGKLTLSFDRVTVKGQAYPIHGVVTQALQSGGYREDAGKIAAGAGVGAILGGILGGFKGAMAGVLIGGGGVVAATEGEDVNLAAGTVLRVRLDSPLTIR